MDVSVLTLIKGEKEKRKKSRRHLENNNTSTYPQWPQHQLWCVNCRYLFNVSFSHFHPLTRYIYGCSYGNSMQAGYNRRGVLSPTYWVAYHKFSESVKVRSSRWRCCHGWFLVRGSSWLADRCWPPCCVLAWPFYCTNRGSSVSSPYKNASPFSPAPVTSFHFNYLLKGPISKYSYTGS